MSHTDDVSGSAVSDNQAHVDESARTVDDPRVIQDLEAYIKGLGEGSVPDRQRLLEQYPQIDAELSDCWFSPASRTLACRAEAARVRPIARS